jgi:hypothetical protein
METKKEYQLQEKERFKKSEWRTICSSKFLEDATLWSRIMGLKIVKESHAR